MHDHSLITLVLSLCLVTACGDNAKRPTQEQDTSDIEEEVEEVEEVEEIDWSNCTQWVHDASGDTLTTYPDDQFTIESDRSTTGLMLNFSDRPWTETTSAFVKKMTDDLSKIDGWGINSGIVLKFEGEPLYDLAEEMAPSPLSDRFESLTHFAMVYMEDPSEAEPPHFPAQVPVEVRFFNEGRNAILEPLRPLKSATRYGFVLPAIKPTSARANCLAPSTIIAELLADSSRPLLSERRRKLLELANLSADQVAALTVFTTQSALDQSIDIAQVIKSQNYAWLDDLDCETEGDYSHCTRSFNAFTFQDSDGIISDTMPDDEYSIKVHFWRPRNRIDELPGILFGHGIGGDVTNVYVLNRVIENLPVMRIAIDAVSHGEHPSAEVVAPFQRVLNFFALDLATQTLQALKARDNFRQSTYDKLQLIELLHQDPDMNQDGRPNLNLDKLGYYGLSLGGIMGVEFLSLEPRIDLAVLAVPGARLVSVLTDGSVIGDFKAAIYALVGGKEIFDGLTPLAQVILDAADPGTYAPYLLGDRRTWTTGSDTASPPHLLMQMSINDEVVPNSSNAALARGINLPHLRTVATPIPMLQTLDGPLSLNHDEQSTVALFQFDRVTVGPQTLESSSHMNVPTGREGMHQARHFITSWLDATENGPVILDPYDVFNIPPLE